MIVRALEPDSALRPPPAEHAGAFGAALDEASQALARADGAENAFAQGRGGLAESVLARAKADALLHIATSAAARATQAVSAVLNMQV